MRITGPSRPSVTSSTSGAKSAGSGNATFTPTTGESAPRAAGGGMPSQPLAGLDALIALQALPSEKPDRRKALKRGHALLDKLESLRIGLLEGSVPEDSLATLTELLGQRGERDEEAPDLEALLDDIELRAKVELAKMGRFVD
ncbi:Flagellar assembly protein FliX [Hartmannibacter diazotrophicus]|uniref:Flagellar assembly protein FliX n=1 Tax=Hartmannibacter diazotrophicus TaxID=1482074 RepID=A0A2C9D916_9HYPH|nr:flagellar assembly protein FliX [Hartmannibacter diazotrophicus]SON56221.1 Flagellar assembly protein FliX [Hartmannibacter diazotrophicus]